MVFDMIKLKANESESGKDDFFDPLRANDGAAEVSTSNINREDVSCEATSPAGLNSPLRARKEWISFKRMLMQRFPVSKTSSVSMVGICTSTKILKFLSPQCFGSLFTLTIYSNYV